MFKKLLLGSSLVLASAGALNASQESGLFVGVNAGIPITSPSYGGYLKSMESGLPTSGIGWALSLDLGYKQALSTTMGLKYYLEYNYNESYGEKTGGSVMFSKVKADIAQQLITINVDYYYNPIDLVGVYIGLGLGYQSFKPTWTPTMQVGSTTIGGETQGGFALPLNLGVTFNATDANQILIGAKIPLIGYDYKPSSNPALAAITQGASGNVKLNTYIVQVGYNYTF